MQMHRYHDGTIQHEYPRSSKDAQSEITEQREHCHCTRSYPYLSLLNILFPSHPVCHKVLPVELYRYRHAHTRLKPILLSYRAVHEQGVRTAMSTSIAALFSPTTCYRDLYVRKYLAGGRLGDGFEEVECRGGLHLLLSSVWVLEEFLTFTVGKAVWTGPQTCFATNRLRRAHYLT
jgi:hypothetical protein